jgi:hypothetical protein
MAAELDVSYSTIRYWLKRLGLETKRSIRRQELDTVRKAGLQRAYFRCPKHGYTAFFERPDGGYRCAKCNTTSVSERRRRVKRKLVAEAGGGCTLCGFDTHPAALQFHHRDLSKKAFHLSHGGMTRGIAGREQRPGSASCSVRTATPWWRRALRKSKPRNARVVLLPRASLVAQIGPG